MGEGSIVGTTRFGKPLVLKINREGYWYVEQQNGGIKPRDFRGLFLSMEAAYNAVKSYERRVKYVTSAIR